MYTTNKENSKGIQILTNNKEIVDMSLEEVLQKLQIKYDRTNDVIIINTDSNLLIQAENSLFISKEDTVFISGDKLGLKGKIYLNPKLIIDKIKKIFRD